MERGFTRRQLLGRTVKLGAAGAIVARLSLRPPTRASAAGFGELSDAERATLDAALARMIPADGPDDWSAADVGAGDYIARLLSGSGEIYAGGPTREHFDEFQTLSRAKGMGWAEEVVRLRALYHEGLAELDARASGSFASAPEALQDAVLTALDVEGSEFFAALYAHTMEGVYGHPVYGGNKQFKAWESMYEGDVHGVRFPNIGDPNASWNVYGGYAPEEMAGPGDP